MPPVLAAFGYVIAGGITVTTASGVVIAAISYATIINYVIVIAAAIAYSSYQSKKMRAMLAGVGAMGGVDTGRSVMSREPVQPRRLIYGACLVSGVMTFLNVSGADNEYLHFTLAVAGHECEELGEVYFNEHLVPLDGSGNATGDYAGYARVKKHLGSPSQTVDTDLQSENAGHVDSTFRGQGVAYLYVRLKYSTDVFPQGMPTVTCVVKGKKVYDWRTATTYYTDNAALCTADYLMSSKFGKGIAQARIRSADIIEAANICDEIVVTEEGEERRYVCGGTINADQAPDEVLLDLCGAMAGSVVDAGGLWTIRAGAYRSPTTPVFTDGDLIGKMSVTPRMSRRDTCNGVKGVYISPINQWSAADFPPVKNDTYMGWDGGVRLWQEMSLNFTTSSATAQRLAKITLERARQQITWTGQFTLKALSVQPGDVIQFTHPRYGWSAKEFEVTNFEFQVAGGSDNPTLAIALTLRETASGVWDWNDGEETTVDLAPNTNLFDSTEVATPTGLTLAMDNIVQTGGAIIPRLRVSWNLSQDVFVQSGGLVHIEYKKHAASNWNIWATGIRGDATFDYITDVESAGSYDVRIRFQNVNGARSAYATQTSYTIGGATLAKPSIDYPGTLFDPSITVTLSVPGGQIVRYTTDGTPVTSAATSGGTSVSLNISSDTVLRARAFDASDPGQFSLELVENYYYAGGGGGGPTFALTLFGNPNPLYPPSGAGSYPPGTVVSISTPDPAGGDTFINWSGPWPDIDYVQTPSSASTFVVMSKDITLYANY